MTAFALGISRIRYLFERRKHSAEARMYLFERRKPDKEGSESAISVSRGQISPSKAGLPVQRVAARTASRLDVVTWGA